MNKKEKPIKTSRENIKKKKLFGLHKKHRNKSLSLTNGPNLPRALPSLFARVVTIWDLSAVAGTVLILTLLYEVPLAPLKPSFTLFDWDAFLSDHILISVYPHEWKGTKNVVRTDYHWIYLNYYLGNLLSRSKLKHKQKKKKKKWDALYQTDCQDICRWGGGEK